VRGGRTFPEFVPPPFAVALPRIGLTCQRGPHGDRIVARRASRHWLISVSFRSRSSRPPKKSPALAEGVPRLRVREQVYEGKRQRLKSKSGRRDLPLSLGMAERLRAHRRDHFTEEKMPVFTTATGEGLRRSNVANRVLSPASKAAGLVVDRDGEEVPWVTFHTFRHTCASLLFENGKNVKQVSEWLDHADPSFTLSTYIHLLDDGIGGADFFDECLVEFHETSR
jgi:hypothetical protein